MEAREFKVETKGGVELTVKTDGQHFRAYDEKGAQVGQPWMEYGNLVKELDIKLPPSAGDKEREDRKTAHAEIEVWPKNEKITELKVKTRSGKELTIKKGQHHFRAYDKDGNQVGLPWMEYHCLSAELDLENIETATKPEPESTNPIPQYDPKAEPNPASRDKCGHFINETCRIDGISCDGQCGEHASRAIDKRGPGEDQDAPNETQEKSDGKDNGHAVPPEGETTGPDAEKNP